MPQPIQLRIPQPCHESWADMSPVDRGRHCAACHKTVVDFTAMSDAELLFHMTQSRRQSVCGRLTSHQLDRPLVSAASMQNGWGGWHWLLAGLLLTREDPGRHAGKATTENKVTSFHRTETITSGMIFRTMVIPKPEPDIVEMKVDSMGDVGIVLLDSVETEVDSFTTRALRAPAHLNDSVLPPISVVEKCHTDHLGGIVATPITVNTESDTTSKLKEFFTDTLRAVGLLPRKELRVYPNPATAGSIVYLEFNLEPGVYQACLFNSSGSLVQGRYIRVNGPGQVEAWGLPTLVSPGIYFLRINPDEGKKPITAQLVIMH